MKKIESVLIKIAEAFNSSNLLWGVGASVLLHKYNLVENPSDIDIVMSIPDIEEADRILSALGEKLPAKDTDIYSTDYFYEYIVDGVNIDIMAGLKINIDNSVFVYKFDEASIPHSFTVGNVLVPFTTLEEWFVLYQLIPGREQKVSLINNFFREKGIEYPYLLQQMTKDKDLPKPIKERLQATI